MKYHISAVVSNPFSLKLHAKIPNKQDTLFYFPYHKHFMHTHTHPLFTCMHRTREKKTEDYCNELKCTRTYSLTLGCMQECGALLFAQTTLKLYK